MTKRIGDIDDVMLEQERLVTATLTMMDTANSARQHTVDAGLRLRHAHRIGDRRGTDIADDEVMSEAWR